MWWSCARRLPDRRLPRRAASVRLPTTLEVVASQRLGSLEHVAAHILEVDVVHLIAETREGLAPIDTSQPGVARIHGEIDLRGRRSRFTSHGVSTYVQMCGWNDVGSPAPLPCQCAIDGPQQALPTCLIEGVALLVLPPGRMPAELRATFVGQDRQARR